MLPIYFVFFVSGISGLIYQVIWVREFGQIFGNTTHSASLVTATFMFGLGLGSFIAGRFIDKIHRNEPSAGLKFYAFAEILIALLCFILAFVIPNLQSLSAPISSYTIGENGWYELSFSSMLLRYVLAVLLIGPVTLLMGATLTLLIRFLSEHSVEHIGWKIGLLYGVNTAGAAIGCALVDLASIPAVGIFSTNLIAVLLNFFAGLAALRMKKYYVPSSRPVLKENLSSHDPILLYAGVAILISGFCAMGMEIIWLRFLTSVYSANRFVFSVMLSIIVGGMWLGSILSGYCSKKFGNPGRTYIFAQILFALSTLLCFLFFAHSARAYVPVDEGGLQLADGASRWLTGLIYILVPALKTVFVPALFMGFAYPILNSLIQNRTEKVGSNAGSLYLWNTTGSVLGAVITGFLLIPYAGIQLSTNFLVLGSVLAIIPVWFQGRYSLRALALLIPFVFVFSYWVMLPKDFMLKNSFITDPLALFKESAVLYSEGVNEFILISEGKSEDRGEYRSLYTNGHTMSGTSYSSLRYMRSFAHIPLLQIEKPERALVICFGVGNTVHAVSLHKDLKQIDVADLSKNVLKQADQFSRWNQGVLKDPRVSVFVNDGRLHMKMQPDNSYDLITLEPPPPTFAGVGSLYSKEFYEIAHQKLKSGGFMTQWLPIVQIAPQNTEMLVKAFLEVFPNAVLLNGAGYNLILMGQKDGENHFDWASVQKHLENRPEVKADLKSIDLGEPVEWLGLFVAGPKHLAKQLEFVDPMVDDLPIIEHELLFSDRVHPKNIFATNTLDEWCPSCFKKGVLVSELSDLASYLEIMQNIYWSPVYLENKMQSGNQFFLSVSKSREKEFEHLLSKYHSISKLAKPQAKN